MTARKPRRWDRLYETKEDQREPAQKDRDRILYTSALRRLAGVTQVVGATEGHTVHNRLTHSLEVAQIARRLAEHLRRQQPVLSKKYGLDPDVAESAALAHDLGHPPFGHVAEKALNRLVTEYPQSSFSDEARQLMAEIEKQGIAPPPAPPAPPPPTVPPATPPATPPTTTPPPSTPPFYKWG